MPIKQYLSPKTLTLGRIVNGKEEYTRFIMADPSHLEELMSNDGKPIEGAVNLPFVEFSDGAIKSGGDVDPTSPQGFKVSDEAIIYAMIPAMNNKGQRIIAVSYHRTDKSSNKETSEGIEDLNRRDCRDYLPNKSINFGGFAPGLETWVLTNTEATKGEVPFFFVDKKGASCEVNQGPPLQDGRVDIVVSGRVLGIKKVPRRGTEKTEMKPSHAGDQAKAVIQPFNLEVPEK